MKAGPAKADQKGSMPRLSPGCVPSSEDDDEEDEEDDSDDEPGRMLRVRADDLDKKAAAIHAVGIFAKATKAQFQPYLETSFEKVLDCIAYFHESVRENVVFAMRHLTSVAYCMHPPSEPWQKGLPTVDTLHPEARRAVDQTLSIYLQRAEQVSACAGLRRNEVKSLHL